MSIKIKLFAMIVSLLVSFVISTLVYFWMLSPIKTILAEENMLGEVGIALKKYQQSINKLTVTKMRSQKTDKDKLFGELEKAFENIGRLELLPQKSEAIKASVERIGKYDDLIKLKNDMIDEDLDRVLEHGLEVYHFNDRTLALDFFSTDYNEYDIDVSQRRQIKRDVRALFQKVLLMNNYLDAVSTSLTEHYGIIRAEIRKIQKQSMTITIIIVSSIFIIFLCIAYYLSARIAHSITTIEEQANIIKNGNLTVRIKGVQTNDEIGSLARSFNSMTEQLYEMKTGLEDTVAARTKELSRLRNYLSNIIDSMPSLLIGVDVDGIVTQWNKTAERATGISVSEALGKKLSEIFPQMASDMKQIAESIKTRNATHQQRQLQPLNSDACYEDMTIYPLITNGVEGAVIRVDDVTERRKAEAEREKLIKTLEFKNRELQDIVYTASHDLRSPLVNIEGFSGELRVCCDRLMELINHHTQVPDDTIQVEELLKQEIPQSLAFITGSTKKMVKLLDGLLQVSRVGTSDIHRIRLDMNKTIREVITAMNHQINASGAVINVDPLPDCMADAHMIDRVFTNLINNALKYLDPTRKGTIHISGRIEQNRSIYCVADNGIGIAPNHQRKVFEIFHRLNPNDDAGGEGLGLTIVTRILDRLDGYIWLESKVGQGCEFYVALPPKQ